MEMGRSMGGWFHRTRTVEVAAVPLPVSSKWEQLVLCTWWNFCRPSSMPSRRSSSPLSIRLSSRVTSKRDKIQRLLIWPIPFKVGNVYDNISCLLRFPSFQFLALGQVFATVFVLFFAKQLRLVSFPSLGKDSFRKVYIHISIILLCAFSILPINYQKQKRRIRSLSCILDISTSSPLHRKCNDWYGAAMYTNISLTYTRL